MGFLASMFLTFVVSGTILKLLTNFLKNVRTISLRKALSPSGKTLKTRTEDNGCTFMTSVTLLKIQMKCGCMWYVFRMYSVSLCRFWPSLATVLTILKTFVGCKLKSSVPKTKFAFGQSQDMMSKSKDALGMFEIAIWLIVKRTL